MQLDTKYIRLLYRVRKLGQPKHTIRICETEPSIIQSKWVKFNSPAIAVAICMGEEKEEGVYNKRENK